MATTSKYKHVQYITTTSIEGILQKPVLIQTKAGLVQDQANFRL